MTAKFLSKCKTAVVLISILLLIFPLFGCGIIIINDMSENSVSKYETDKKFFETETAYIPVEYTLYQNDVNSYAMAEKYLSDLPQRDFDGAVFFITTPDTDYIDPDNTESNVSKKIIERNRIIEDQYNISVITSLTDASTILREVKNAVASDSYYTDLMMIPVYMTGQFRMAKVLMNLRSLPFLDLDAPYFNRESAAMTSGGYETYGVAGYASLSPSAFSAVYFSRDIVKEAGMAMPYSLVTAGKWTWDKFFEYTSAVTDINGQGEKRLYTVGSQNNASRIADLIFASCGNTYVSAAEKSVPKISFTSASAQYAVNTAHKILTDPDAVMDSTAGAISCFTNGEMLFLVEYLYVMPWMTNSAADWGVLPLPTENEGDAYRTLVSNNELIFTVPANHTNGEMASVILSALNAGTYGYLYDEYVENNMIHVLRDNDSVNMLETILKTASFDFALAFGNAYPSISAGTYGLIRNAAVSNDLAERYPEAVEKASNTLNEYFNLEY